MHAFAKVEHHLDDITYWRLLGKVMDSSLLERYHQPLFENLLTAERPHADYLMYDFPGALETYASLPDTFTAYRGHSSNQGGMHYTLDPHTAFSYAYESEWKDSPGKFISTVRMRKRDCFYIGRTQGEIVYVPGRPQC